MRSILVSLLCMSFAGCGNGDGTTNDGSVDAFARDDAAAAPDGVGTAADGATADAHAGVDVLVDSSAGHDTGVDSALDTAPAMLEISPPSKDFGPTAQFVTTPIFDFKVTNTGGRTSGPIPFSLGGTNAMDFTIANADCGAPLDPAAFCTIRVSFTPIEFGTRNATLNIGSDSEKTTVMLTGTGVAQ